jgi:hypothetical protein
MWSLVGVLTLSLSACNTSNSYARRDSFEPVRYENDMVYVATVEAAARKHGVGVVWVHPPRKVSAAKAAPAAAP